MSANPNNQRDNRDEPDAWDEICVNPQKLALERGQSEGREAGLIAGFNDGKTVGIVKGVEYGMEMGFIRGVVMEISNALSENPGAFGEPTKLERLQRNVLLILELLDSFPSPDESLKHIGRTTTTTTTVSVSNDFHDDEEENQATSTPSSSDLVGHMQRIRAKFKLLTVQLQWHGFSLKTVMDTANERTPTTTGSPPLQNTSTSEW